MKHVHGGGITLFHLDRVNIDLIIIMVDIEKKLGGIDNGRSRIGRMLELLDREIGDRFHIEQEGTSQHKEVGKHLIAEPIRREVGKTIEDIASAAPVLVNDLVQIEHEALEPVLGIEHERLDIGIVYDQGRVLGETEISDRLAVSQNGLTKSR